MRIALVSVAALAVAALVLAGCSGPEAASTTVEADQLRLSVTAAPEGKGWRLEATVLHIGDKVIRYMDGCRHEWDWGIRDAAGKELDLGLVTCDGFQDVTFMTRQTDHFGQSWHLDHYQGDVKKKAPKGDYVFHITFLYETGSISAEVPFTVR